MNYNPPQIVLSNEQLSEALGETMRRVFLWMFVGLLATAFTAGFTALTSLHLLVLGNPLIFFGLIIGELALVVGISVGIRRLAPMTALALFFLYAVVNGLTLSVIFFAYAPTAIAVSFFATACMFGAMALLGYTTQADFSKFGTFLIMGLIGLIIAMVINLFLASSALDWIISIAGILIFLGLTAYDTQKIKRMLAGGLAGGDELVVSRVSVIGALSLYLDFINLLLFVLRFTGRRR